MNALVFLATGFDEIEATGTVNVLRRGNLETLTVSITGDRTVTGSHDIPVVADELFENVDCSLFDALVLPGGLQGSLMLNSHEGVRKALVEHYNSGKLIAAICASPRVFGNLGLLDGKKATCYPDIKSELKGATIVNAPAVTDRNVITGQGPGLVFDFALEILNYCVSDSCANDVAKDLLL